MVGWGHRSHYTGLAGPVLSGDLAGPYACPQRQDSYSASCLVLQDPPTFSDALALVRQEIWQHRYFLLSEKYDDVRKMQPEVLNYLRNAAFYTP